MRPPACSCRRIAVGRVAGQLRRRPRRRRPRGGAGGLPRATDFEDYYSSEPAGEFATAGHGQQHPGVGPRLRRRRARCACRRRCSARLQRRQPRRGRPGCSPTPASCRKFFGLILPHGLLELTAVVIAGGAGLRLGWAVHRARRPHPRPTRSARRAGGRRHRPRAGRCAFVVAGLIEGFVTPRRCRPACGSASACWSRRVFVVWVVVQGRAAPLRGVTGAMGELDRGWDDAGRSPGAGLAADRHESQPAGRLDLEVGVGQAPGPAGRAGVDDGGAQAPQAGRRAARGPRARPTAAALR